MLSHWEDQYNEQRRRDNRGMMRLKQEDIDERTKARDAKLKNPKEKGMVIRSVMREQRENNKLKSIWVVREGEEVHVNDEEEVKEEVRAFFQRLFDSRGEDPREEEHTHA